MLPWGRRVAHNRLMQVLGRLRPRQRFNGIRVKGVRRFASVGSMASVRSVTRTGDSLDLTASSSSLAESSIQCARMETPNDRMSQRTLVITLFFATTIGCGALDSSLEKTAANTEIEARTGHHRELDDVALTRFEAMKANGLTLDEATAMALISRHDVNESFERIGIAKAARVQAALLPNPSLTAGYLWTDDVGPNKRQFSIAQPIAELFVMPNRIRAADLLLDVEIRRAVTVAIGAASEARLAWRRVQALERMLAVETEGVDLARRSSEIAAARIANGSASDLDRATAEAMAADVETARLRVEQRLAEARIDFGSAVGAAGDPRVVAGTSDDPWDEGIQHDDVATAIAIERRLEIWIADAELAVAQFDLEREETAVLGDVRIGGTYERVMARLLGPVVTLTLPIFDSGAARREAARGAVRVARERSNGVRESVIAEIRVATMRVRTAAAVATHLRTCSVPLAEEVAKLAESRFESGEDDIDPWLESMRSLLDRRRQLAQAEFENAEARSALERAMGGWFIKE